MENSIEWLESQLRAARQAEHAAKRQRMLDTPIVYRYVIEPDLSKRHSDDVLYDRTCVRYVLRRFAVNAAEAKAAGHPEHELREGASAYLYNTGTAQIVCSVGGGTSYIFPPWNKPDDGADVRAFLQIGRFLLEHADGGDITDIVKMYLLERGLS
jgi:hypothetical protein